MKRFLTVFVLACALSALAWPQNHVPRETWMRYADPQQAGWSTEKLAQAQAYWESLDSAALLVVENGAVVVAWGDVARRYMCHSVRKSFMSGLYGLHVDAGTIDREWTMAELGIDDDPPLTDEEKTARVVDLLSARSGVYRLAAYESPQNPKPPRGSHAPGTNWVYNNWDFNTLCTIFEQATGKKVFEEFGQRFATPLGMQDYRVRDGYYHYELDKSIHPAYPFRMSARDCARFGLLFLYGGLWGDERILSEGWVRESTTAHSDTGNGGYGYLWWTFDDPRVADTGFYSAQGVGGQTIAVLPKRGLVMVNRTDTYLGKNVGGDERLQLFDLILQAKTGESSAEPELVPLEAAERLETAPLGAERLAEYTGVYEVVFLDFDASVSADGGTLLLDTPSAGVFGLIPVEGDVFLAEDIRTYVLFERKPEDDRGSLIWEYGLLREFANRSDAGDLDGAVELAELAVELFPMSSLSHYILAAVFAETGDPGLARGLCEAALELDPQNGEASTLLEALSAR